MNRAYAGAGASANGSPAIAPRVEDRWLPVPGRRVSFAMTGVVLASLAVHVLVLALAALDKHPDVAQPEITVELVQDPKPEPPKPEAPKPAPESAKAEPPAATPEPPKPEPKAEAPKAEPPKPEAAKPEPPKPAPPKEASPPEPPKPEAKAASQSAADAAADAKLAASQKALQDLQREYESLKAEQDALKAEAATQADSTQAVAGQAAAAPADATGGATVNGMPPSFAAVALPGLSEIDGVATSYQELVFSQLAKAKGIRQHMGLPGTARVVFDIDANGKLLDASIAVASGVDKLDAEALEIVRAAAPFPKPPPGAERTFTANFSFVPQATP